MANLSASRTFGSSDAAPPAPDAFGQRDTNPHLAWLAEASRANEKDPYQFVLILRFALVNLLGFGLLAIAATQGMVAQILAADRTYLTAVIFIVFLGGLALCGWKILRTSRELNRVRNFNPLVPSKAAEYLAKMRGSSSDSRAILAGALRLKLSQGIAAVRHTAGSLVLLGLIGTVIGFIIALSGVDPETASDVSAVAPMISTLISGMSTALYTTLVGSILNMWLMANYQLLAGGTVALISSLAELVEKHA